MAVQSNYKQWQYGQDGPGGGSVPYNVMATGALAPFNPAHVRGDIQPDQISARTQIPVGMRPGYTSEGPYPDTTPNPMAGAFGAPLIIGSFVLPDSTRIAMGVGIATLLGAAIGALANSASRGRGAGFGALTGIGAGLATVGALVTKKA